MKRQLFILIGGSDAQNGDYSHLHRLAKNGRTSPWSTLKTARPGDQVLIYIQHPHSALVAEATVLEEPVKGEPGDYPYRAKVGSLKLLPNRVTLEDLRLRFPKWAWLRYPRRGIAVPAEFDKPLSQLVHKKQSRVQILHCATRPEQQKLEQLAMTGRSAWWSAPPLTAQGDTVLFYAEKPEKAIVAVGQALSGTRATSGLWPEAKVGHLRLLEAPVTIAELRDVFPHWAWLNSLDKFAYVSADRAQQLMAACGTQSPGSPRQTPRRNVGAGFGNAADNRKVEQTAVRIVTAHFKKKGYRVTSREKENLGYDLDATKNGTCLHVEVKGVRNGLPSFPITANEVRRASADPRFRLAIVTHALDRRPVLRVLSGKEFTGKYKCEALSFMARPIQ